MWAGLLIGTYIWFIGTLIGILVELVCDEDITIIPKVALLWIMSFAIIGMIIGQYLGLQVVWIRT